MSFDETSRHMTAFNQVMQMARKAQGQPIVAQRYDFSLRCLSHEYERKGKKNTLGGHMGDTKVRNDGALVSDIFFSIMKNPNCKDAKFLWDATAASGTHNQNKVKHSLLFIQHLRNKYLHSDPEGKGEDLGIFWECLTGKCEELLQKIDIDGEEKLMEICKDKTGKLEYITLVSTGK